MLEVGRDLRTAASSAFTSLLAPDATAQHVALPLAQSAFSGPPSLLVQPLVCSCLCLPVLTPDCAGQLRWCTDQVPELCPQPDPRRESGSRALGEWGVCVIDAGEAASLVRSDTPFL